MIKAKKDAKNWINDNEKPNSTVNSDNKIQKYSNLFWLKTVNVFSILFPFMMQVNVCNAQFFSFAEIEFDDISFEIGGKIVYPIA